MERHEIYVTGYERGIYGYLRKVTQGYLRLVIRSAWPQPKAALIAHSDLEMLERFEEIAALARQAQLRPEFRDALAKEGIEAQALELVWRPVPELQALRKRTDRAAGEAMLRGALEQLGAVISSPSGEPVDLRDRWNLVDAGEPPLSEQIIAERR